MGRRSSVDSMAPEAAAVVDAVIRQYRYGSLDDIKAELQKRGIELPRTSLWRRVTRLRELDARHLGSPHDLVIIVVERSTGSTTTITTAADKSAVLSAIERLNSPLK
jgi:hypothetical protein